MISSLWSVDDATTRKVMQRFYENLWKFGMPEAAALRDAQLTILRENASENDAGSGLERIGRSAHRRTSPAAWAGWVLSADWQSPHAR